jgi:hypothetical protein
VTTVDGETPTVLDIGGDVTPVGFVENHLLYARDDGVLLAVPFDVRRRRTTGPPRAIANGIGVIGATMSVTALSANGTFVYAADEDRTELVFMGDTGAPRILLEANAFHDQPRVSPDGAEWPCM